MQKITLYRGDSTPINHHQSNKGQTFSRYYLGNGLMTKFIGSSAILEGMDEVDMVLAHVGYGNNTREQQFSHRSPMLSFAKDDEDAAFRFININRQNLEECHFEEAKQFIWLLEIDSPKPLTLGKYELSYKKDPKNVEHLVVEKFHRGIQREAETGDFHQAADAVAEFIAAKCSPSSNHKAIIYDVVTFIKNQDTSHKDQNLVERTLLRATRDKEWLVYPCDPMPDGNGVESRLQMNKHLKAHRWYRENK